MEAKKAKPLQASQSCVEEGTKVYRLWEFTLTFNTIASLYLCKDIIVAVYSSAEQTMKILLAARRTSKELNVSSSSDIHSIAI